MAHHEENIKLENHLAMTQHEYEHHKTDVWKTTILLSVVTIVEVVFAIYYEKSLIPMGWPLWALRLFLVLASVLKAFYIMAVFMHVKHEKKAFIFTILVPFTLLIWMIIAFLYDGDSWNSMNKGRFGEKPHPAVVEQNKGVTKHH
jgi:cytochrome c oxidase subunit IV